MERAEASRQRVWQVGALCRAVTETLEARFGYVTVRGELSGFSRAASGHCYFSLKDSTGQLRCALFRRAASQLGWMPRDGELVEVQARLSVYEGRGDLQLIVERMQRAGQGALYEDFLRRKAALEAQGLFDPARKRTPTAFPRGIGLVTSSGAAALRDVATALQRRAPQVPVVLVPALVQGAAAPATLVDALESLYAIVRRQQAGEATQAPPIDTILLVRGGGSLEDLWAFNDERLAHTIVQSPVPLISGIGHETDVTIADFCADLRAPTPTAAAELAALPAEDAWQLALARQQRLQQLLQRQLDGAAQRLDRLGWGLARSGQRVHAQQLHLQALGLRLQQQRQRGQEQRQSRLQQLQQRLHLAVHRQGTVGEQSARLQALQQRLQLQVEQDLRDAARQLQGLQQGLQQEAQQALQQSAMRLAHADQALRLLDPALVLQRGYALLQDEAGQVLSSVQQLQQADRIRATVHDGQVALRPAAVD